MNKKKAAQEKEYDPELMDSIEKKVTKYLQNNCSFTVFEVKTENERLELESKLIGTVSACDECEAGDAWLGKKSSKPEVRESGLWLSDGVCRKFTQDELGKLMKRRTMLKNG